MNNKVFVSCAVTGSGDTAKKHPDLPKTPKQIATAAIEAAKAGAAIAHIHVREEDGKPSRRLELYKEGLLSDPPMFQMCLGIPWGAPATTLAMQAMKDIMPKEGVWSGFAISKNEMPYVAQTVVMGGNPRVGLEDNLYLSKGKLATNAQLVEKAVRIIDDLGSSIMTPAETREQLKLIKHK